MDRKESCRIGVNSEKRSGLFEDLEMKVEENGKNLNEIRSLEYCNGAINVARWVTSREIATNQEGMVMEGHKISVTIGIT